MAVATTIELGGIPVEVTIEGDGPPLLLINGLGGSMPVWTPLRRRLRDRTTIAFDAPGTGGTPSSRLPMLIPQVACLTGRLLDELGHEQPVDVLGFSLGGVIAQQLAWSRPRHVRRLALMSTNTIWGSAPSTPRAFGMLFSLRRFTDADHYAEIAPRLLGGRMRTDPELVGEIARARTSERLDVRGYAWQMLSCMTWSTLPFLPLIRQPTVVINGDDDPLARPFNARMIARLIPHARLRIVQGGGHHLVLERPDEVCAILREHFEEG